jgi:hypothetical protein
VSDSPIGQGGKLVGAVTYVMVNDPTRGYSRINDLTGAIAPVFFVIL